MSHSNLRLVLFPSEEFPSLTPESIVASSTETRKKKELSNYSSRVSLLEVDVTRLSGLSDMLLNALQTYIAKCIAWSTHLVLIILSHREEECQDFFEASKRKIIEHETNVSRQ
jgi:hypothetical protein